MHQFLHNPFAFWGFVAIAFGLGAGFAIATVRKDGHDNGPERFFLGAIAIVAGVCGFGLQWTDMVLAELGLTISSFIFGAFVVHVLEHRYWQRRSALYHAAPADGDIIEARPGTKLDITV